MHIYVASRASIPKRSAMWLAYRQIGAPIISSWIDEAGEGETDDFEALWLRKADEIEESGALVLYAEPGDFPLKGALVEVGMALGRGKRVFVAAPGVECHPRSLNPLGSWMRHPLVTRNDNLSAVLAELSQS